MTNEDLARMIAEGFAETASKADLKKVEDRLSGRIDGVEGRLRFVETKLDRALFTEITRLDTRVTRLEKKTGLTE